MTGGGGGMGGKWTSLSSRNRGIELEGAELISRARGAHSTVIQRLYSPTEGDAAAVKYFVKKG